MTEREAILNLKKMLFHEESNGRFKNADTIMIAIKSLAKQIGRKPIIFDCCECGNTVSDRLDNRNFPLELEYCPYCGQKQDWSE